MQQDEHLGGQIVASDHRQKPALFTPGSLLRGRIDLRVVTVGNWQGDVLPLLADVDLDQAQAVVAEAGNDDDVVEGLRSLGDHFPRPMAVDAGKNDIPFGDESA